MMKRRNQLTEDEDEGELSDLDLKTAPGMIRTSSHWYHYHCRASYHLFSAYAHRLTNEEILKILCDNPTVEQMRICFEALRRTLSRSKNPPVDEVIACGLVNALVQALSVEVGDSA